MGSGKSTYAIEKIINEDCNSKRYLCVLPSLNECQRYKDSINAEIVDPDCWGTKTKHLQHLINQNNNIVTTHSLITKIDETTLQLLALSEYTLIIDECLDVLHRYENLKPADIKTIFSCNFVTVNEKGFLVWNTDEYDGRFNDVKRLCDIDALMAFKNIYGEYSSILMWNFPTMFFSLFKESYILTYYWAGSIQKSYFDLHEIQYQHKTLYNGALTDYNITLEFEQRRKIKELVTIYEGKLNLIGKKISKSHPLSKSWYEKQKRDENSILLKELSNNVKNYFWHIIKSPSNDNMYTTFKNFEKDIKGKGYTKGFIACNSKGTNEYKDKKALAYTINLFLNDDIVKFFKFYGIEVNQDLFSLSELLQWIWRSQIREGKPINVYIPSERMRNLLFQWLDCSDITFIQTENKVA